MTETTDRFRDWDAAYLLGALSHEDRRAFERHLATCTDCTEAVAQLSGLPGILGKLGPEDAVALLGEPDATTSMDSHLRDDAHTPGLVQRLAGAARRRRRRARIGMLASIAAVAAIIAVGGVALASTQVPAVTEVAMSPQGQHSVTAKLAVLKKGWGTRFDWSCSYHGTSWEGAGTVSYDLVVTERSGAQRTVATWTSSGLDATGLSASTAIPTADIRNVQIRFTGTTTPLLTENL